MWRRQLPVWSPVTVPALLKGALARSRNSGDVASLERRISAAHAATAVQLSESGTAALALAMRAAAPEGARPRIALPARGCYDLMTAADIADAEVVLYDLDASSLEPERASFDDALRWRPHAAVIAHWFGVPVRQETFRAALDGAGVMLIEDAAQAAGASAGGHPLGSLGDFGVLSFGRGKGRTGGRGGALLANSDVAAARVRSAARAILSAENGKLGLLSLAAQWAIGRPWLYAIPASIPQLHLGETMYHAATPIHAMPAWATAVAGALWDQSMAECRSRRVAAQRWTELLERRSGVRQYAEPAGAESSWLRFPVLAGSARSLLDDDARRLGVMPGYVKTLAALPVAAGRLARRGEWPGANVLASRLRTLPTHSLLRPGDFAAIVELIDRDARQS